jgi:Tol biopolymer transport system component
VNVSCRPQYWDRDGWVAFSTQDADSVDLWRIRIDPLSGRVDGPPSRILAGPGQFTGADASDSGRIVVANEASDADIWSLPADVNRAMPLGSEPSRIVRAPGADLYPSISADGRLVSFQTDRSGGPEQWVLSVEDGTTRAVAPIYGHGILSASGERIAACWIDSRLTIVTVEGLIEQTFEGPGGFPWGFSPDESLVLYNRLEGRTRGIWAWDRASDETAELIGDSDVSYYQGQFSPDGHWVTWQSNRFGVEVAPFRGLQPVSDSERVNLSPEGWDADKPRWSPDGNVMYFVSPQDGYDCIYAQPLDPDSKQPRGEVVEIYHSHESSISISNVTPPRNEISVAGDRIVFGMEEQTSNLWVIEPER